MLSAITQFHLIMRIMFRQLQSGVCARLILACCLLGLSFLLAAQENPPTAEKLLLEATKEQYKLDNESREKQWLSVQNRWAQTLSDIEQFVNNDVNHNEQSIGDSLDGIDRLIEDAKTSIKNSTDALKTNKLLLEGLGNSPISGSEPESLTETRNQLKLIQSFYENQIKKLDELSTNAENLKLALSQLRRTELAEIIKARLALPFLPSTITTALKTATTRTAGFVISMREWRTKHSKSSQLWATRIVIVLSIALAYFLGKFINQRFGRNPDIESPTHSRKLSAAVAQGVATGLIPMTIIGVLFTFLNSVYAIDTENFNRFINTVLGHLLVLSIAITLCIAILSPRYPQWGLTSLSASSSSRIGKGLIFLILVVILDSLIFTFLNIEPDYVSSFSVNESRTTSFFGTIFNVLKAVGLIYLCRPSIWVDIDDKFTEKESNAVDTLWALIRGSVIVLSCISIIASFMGHVYLGGYITFGIFITMILFGICIVVRHAAHDSVSFIIKQKWLRKNFNLRIVTLQKIKFWAQFIIDPLIFGAALLIILPFWGVPVEKLLQWVRSAFDGFNIGELRISLKGILLCIIVFIALMRLTRFIQTFTKQNIFPKSSQNLAEQHNTLTIINYLGVIIALCASIAALGIDFQTIAIIMGALSVGIGFGLRNVVSNFVSGLLLLVEKPIKVGDWIQIGEHEGFVKDLKFRSTELETFQQASVIIPNADLISQPVINMTFADQKGRIEVPVSVAYNTDPVLLHNLLIDLAQAHPDVLNDPGPMVMFMNFGESALDFELRCFTSNVINKTLIASELRFQIERLLKDKEIEIPFPQRVVHMKENNRNDSVEDINTKLDNKHREDTAD